MHQLQNNLKEVPQSAMPGVLKAYGITTNAHQVMKLVLAGMPEYKRKILGRNRVVRYFIPQDSYEWILENPNIIPRHNFSQELQQQLWPGDPVKVRKCKDAQAPEPTPVPVEVPQEPVEEPQTISEVLDTPKEEAPILEASEDEFGVWKPIDIRLPQPVTEDQESRFFREHDKVEICLWKGRPLMTAETLLGKSGVVQEDESMDSCFLKVRIDNGDIVNVSPANLKLLEAAEQMPCQYKLQKTEVGDVLVIIKQGGRGHIVARLKPVPELGVRLEDIPTAAEFLLQTLFP